jgi:hypothetical protein
LTARRLSYTSWPLEDQSLISINKFSIGHLSKNLRGG